MALTDSKEITEIAYKIVSMLAKYPPMRQQEILAVAQVLVNLDCVRLQNAPITPKLNEDNEGGFPQ